LNIVVFETNSRVTLTLTLDDLESHIVVNVSLTLTNSTVCLICGLIEFDCGCTYGRTYIRVRTDPGKSWN